MSREEKEFPAPSGLEISSSIITNQVPQQQQQRVCTCEHVAPARQLPWSYFPKVVHVMRLLVDRCFANLIAKFHTSWFWRYRVTISSSLCYLDNDQVLMNNPIFNPLYSTVPSEGTRVFNSSSEFLFLSFDNCNERVHT